MAIAELVVPLRFVTLTLIRPATCAGVSAVICVSESIVYVAAAVVPNITFVTLANPVPTSVTVVPPVVEPEVRDIDNTTGEAVAVTGAVVVVATGTVVVVATGGTVVVVVAGTVVVVVTTGAVVVVVAPGTVVVVVAPGTVVVGGVVGAVVDGVVVDGGVTIPVAGIVTLCEACDRTLVPSPFLAVAVHEYVLPILRPTTTSCDPAPVADFLGPPSLDTHVAL